MKADQVTSLLGMGWERTGLEGWSTWSRPEGLGTECRVKADPVSGWTLVADGGVMLRDRVKGEGGQDLCGGNAPASTPRLPRGLHWLCGVEDLPRLTPGLLLSKTKHLTSYLKWPPHVPPPSSHLSCCHNSGLAHGT